MLEVEVYLPETPCPVRLIEFADYMVGAVLNRGAAAPVPDYFLFDAPTEGYHVEIAGPR